jgi:plasmid replication initiation protein
MSAPVEELRREVIKHSASIQIESNITLLQRRAWNVLLYHAYNALPVEEVHHIPLRELARVLEYDSHDEQYLKEALRALVSCRVEWNLLNKDGKAQWGVATLLAQALIENGICAYAYAPEIRKRLHNPFMYARLDLSLQNRFSSKHAQALWELCADYLGAGREHGETPFITVGVFRKLIGADDSYQNFKKLNARVIKPALAEINEVSDFRVTVEHQCQGRKVVALKFKICRVPLLPVARQAELFPDHEDMPAVVKLLTDAGLALQDAFAVWQEGFNIVEPGTRPAAGDNPELAFTRYVREKIHLLEQRQKGTKIENPAGFLLTAIKKNYTNAKFAEKEARNERQSKVKELRALKDQKEKIERERDDVLKQACDKVMEAFPEMAERAVDALQGQHNAAFRHCYDAGKSAVENYKGHRFIAEMIGQWLESELPEDFEKKKKPFRKKLEAIDARIKALESEGVKAAVRA